MVFRATAWANGFMNTEGGAAVGAVPPDLLTFQECPDTVFTDGLQVADHAHVVFQLVPFIELLQVPAGKVIAPGAEF